MILYFDLGKPLVTRSLPGLRPETYPRYFHIERNIDRCEPVTIAGIPLSITFRAHSIFYIKDKHIYYLKHRGNIVMNSPYPPTEEHFQQILRSCPL